VLGAIATFVGCLVTVRLLGVLEAEQTEKGKTIRNDRLIGAPETEKIRPAATTLSEMPDALLGEIEHFFVSYNQAEGRRFEVLGRRGSDRRGASHRARGSSLPRVREGKRPAEGRDPATRVRGSRHGRTQRAVGRMSMSGLEREHPGVRGAGEVVRRELDRAAERLAGRWPPADAAVHDVRKRLKKARAALRLERRALGPREFRRANHALRDAARPLAEIRDSGVMLGTLDKLLSRRTGIKRSLAPLRRALATRRAAARDRLLGTRRRTMTLEALRAVEGRLLDRKPRRRGWSALGPGVRRVYRSGRQALAAARSEPTPARLHEWRKQAKYLSNALRILEPIGAPIQRLEKKTHRLADQLGDDHDLVMLRERSSDRRVRVPAAARTELLRLIDERRARLWRRATVLGASVYDDAPRSFESRVEKLWRSWRRRR
jgi:hypothetical protein